MDFTTLTYVLVLVVGFLGVDAAMHPPDAILQGEAVGTFKDAAVTSSMVSDVLNAEVERISSTPTLMTAPVIRVGRLKGLAMSIAESMKLEEVAYAFQAQLGYQTDDIKITLYGEGGTQRALVIGTGRQHMKSFEQEVIPRQGESTVSLLERATVIGMAHIDPYITALSELQRHADDKDFSVVEAITDNTMGKLPHTPVSFDRSLFENLKGLIFLFRGEVEQASYWFGRAEDSCPDFTKADAVSAVNAAFADVQIGNYKKAIARMNRLLHDKRPTDAVILSTAYTTLAAAQMGLWEQDAAEQALGEATTIYPNGSSSYDFWGDVKQAQGDFLAAAKMHQKALENSGEFENYAEIATLYFRLAWRDNMSVMRSRYSNPGAGALRRLGSR